MGKSIVKGLIGALLGIMLATIGSAPIDGASRFTFGFTAMNSGFNIIAVMIGFFAISEVINAAEESVVKRETSIIQNVIVKGFGVSFKEMFEQKWNILRSAIIGTFIGMLPGLGGALQMLFTRLRETNPKTRNSARDHRRIVHRRRPTTQL